MRIMSGQDRSAAAAHETINLLHKVRTVAVQQTPVRDYRTPTNVSIHPAVSWPWLKRRSPVMHRSGL
jgi:hypothetical protein